MLKNVLSFILNSSVLLAIFALIFSLGLHKSWAGNFTYSIGIFLGVLGIYNFHRWYKFKRNTLDTSLKIGYEKHQYLLLTLAILGISGAGIVVIYCSIEKLNLLYSFMIFFLISIFYDVLKLREIPFLKASFVALTWTFVLVIYPHLLQEKATWMDLSFFFLFYALTIPADIKDLTLDSPKLKTLPQLIGKNSALVIALFTFIVFIGLQNDSFYSKSVLLIITIVWFLSIYTLNKRFPRFQLELTDGILVILGIVYWLK